MRRAFTGHGASRGSALGHARVRLPFLFEVSEQHIAEADIAESNVAEADVASCYVH